jgi:hypothetical protein
MPKKEEEKQKNFELSEKQIALVKLATLSLGLSNLFTSLASETNNQTAKKTIERINITLDTIDNIIEEELLEIDLTNTRS